MENVNKLKTVELGCHPFYPDGAIAIKEDTSVERPVALLPFPVGKHERGTEKQRQYARLLAAAPEILEKLENLMTAVGVLDDYLLKDSYPDAVLAHADAKDLLERLK